MKLLILATIILATLAVPHTASAQGTAYANDGRPQFCWIADAAMDVPTSERVVGVALDDLNISPRSLSGRNMLRYSQRLLGWLFLLYSQDNIHWYGEEQAMYDLEEIIAGLIRNNEGEVPGLVNREMPVFNRAVAGCRRR